MAKTAVRKLHVGIGAVVHRDSVLLVRREAPAVLEYDKKWELPGGKIEPGETTAQAIVRELLEETGYEATFRGILPFDYRHDLPLTDPPLHVVVDCGLCDLALGSRPDAIDPVPSSAGSHEYAWFSFKDLPFDDTVPGTREFLAWISHHLGYAIPSGARLYHVVLENQKGSQYTISLEFRPETVTTPDVSPGDDSTQPFVLTSKWGGAYDPQHRASRPQSFVTMADALADARRRLNERRRNGYFLVDIDENNPLRSWLRYVKMPTTRRAYPALYKERDLGPWCERKRSIK